MNTYDNVRRQYATNAAQMADFARQADRTGRKVRGMSADFWHEKARTYRALSTADDAAVSGHLRIAQQSIAARLQELAR